ncbi:hypothetical protein K1719_015618 [Acacia pycnantha]|nr:hypothetical protein K1719_015618 [Acacia pycnantha]
MKFLGVLPVDLLKTSSFVKLTAFLLFSLSLIFVLNHYSSTYSSRTFFSGSASGDNSSSTVSSPDRSPVPPPHQKLFVVPPLPPVERMGVVDDNGVMSDDFKIGELDASLMQELGNLSEVRAEKEGESDGIVRIERFKVCEPSMTDYIPCLDNEEWIKRLNSSQRGEKYERHCPEEGKGLHCLLPRPKGYKSPIPWPKSRDEVWFANVPHTRLVEDKGGQNWISIKKDKFVFPGGGTQFIHGADKYLDQISAMVTDIAFGYNTRVALDIGCGVASFGAYLMQRNVTTLSIAPKDVHENQAFDLIHCSRCRINWTRDDGILLLEADRLLRAGGYFVWAAQPVYKHEEILQDQWKEMENLTAHVCWELVRKEGYIAIWRKPMNNSCYLSHDIDMQLPICDSNDNPDEVWYTDLKACISRLPSSAYVANVSKWPARLHQPPDRLQSIKMDAHISRKELFKAESKYWKEIIDSYVGAYHWKEYNLRNVMDMRAGFGGFAAALHDVQIDCWVMNVVPVGEFNTLPVVYDRGLIGVIHDWCEPFDTYPRTYDLLHATGLFSAEKKRKRCNISTVMLEMDRLLRPGGRVYIRDSLHVISEVEEIANAMGWVNFREDVGEGPYASWKILRSEKRF